MSVEQTTSHLSTSAKKRGMSFWPRLFFSYIIIGYQKFISPLFKPRCRYGPTCSEYAKQALMKYGVIKGGWLAIQRVARCHPWQPGGYDPVP